MNFERIFQIFSLGANIQPVRLSVLEENEREGQDIVPLKCFKGLKLKFGILVTSVNIYDSQLINTVRSTLKHEKVHDTKKLFKTLKKI